MIVEAYMNSGLIGDFIMAYLLIGWGYGATQWVMTMIAGKVTTITLRGTGYTSPDEVFVIIIILMALNCVLWPFIHILRDK